MIMCPRVPSLGTCHLLYIHIYIFLLFPVAISHPPIGPSQGNILTWILIYDLKIKTSCCHDYAWNTAHLTFKGYSNLSYFLLLSFLLISDIDYLVVKCQVGSVSGIIMTTTSFNFQIINQYPGQNITLWWAYGRMKNKIGLNNLGGHLNIYAFTRSNRISEVWHRIPQYTQYIHM
jgi:hypothetical protein